MASVASIEEVWDALQDAVQDVVDASHSTDLGVVYDNAPLAAASSPGTTKALLRVSILDGQGEQVDMGSSSRRWRRVGVLLLAFHVEANRGTELLSQMLDTFTVALRGTSLATPSKGEVTLRAPGMQNLGLVDGGWWQTNLTFPFWSDEFDS